MVLTSLLVLSRYTCQTRFSPSTDQSSRKAKYQAYIQDDFLIELSAESEISRKPRPYHQATVIVFALMVGYPENGMSAEVSFSAFDRVTEIDPGIPQGTFKM
ncbi:hypothetical protein AVEN_118748-1 [Araneus ventricosus]|uniref:Uncharacterized protein n=1 Tax=Araneus ventricosus TaxID=182803 RepID=A0A4Y2BW88_ARAVE|nr:hypothetical protein AVEN_118748-1 [Araneus ventricosus]